jgi:hypothetical protein
MPVTGVDSGVVEVVLFRPRPGVTDEQILRAMDALQADVASFAGYRGRRVLRGDESQWGELVDWATLADAEHCATAILERPAAHDLLGLVEMDTIEHHHLALARQYGAPEGAAAGVVELVLARASAGASDADVLALAGALQRQVETFPGFLRRRVLHGDDGLWVDVLDWTTLDEALRAAEAIEAQPGIEQQLAVLDMASLRMLHLAPVRVYA